MTDKEKQYNSFVNLLSWIIPEMIGYELEFSENYETYVSEEITHTVDTSFGDVVEAVEKEIDVKKATIGGFDHDTLEVNLYSNKLDETVWWKKDFTIEKLLELTNLLEIVEDYLRDCRAIKNTNIYK